MALLASISGVRGTLGGQPGTNLTPPDIVKFAAAYGTWLQQTGAAPRVVVGRDARPSGPMVQALVSATLQSLGLHVIDLGLTTTPTVELAVPAEQAGGGIILTASHNPVEWNALKLLNARGEFISSDDGAAVLALYASEAFSFVPIHELGQLTERHEYLDYHIEHVLRLPLVDAKAIQAARFRVAVDAVNSSGGIYIPALLRRLGVAEVHELHCEPSGNFAHNPEPLAEHLGDIRKFVAERKLDLGIVVDPDVDRLAFIDERGEMFGEEYTLVLVADYVLRHEPGPAVSNLSSSRALADIAARHGQAYHASAVGEVNVVQKMKAVGATIGGEGNGGIIYPASHYGRDALVGVALALTHIAKLGQPLSAIRASYPAYYMAKQKIEAKPGMDLQPVLDGLAQQAEAAWPNEAKLDTIDGLKINLRNSWAHLRKSNTEPIIRVYTEAPTADAAWALANQVREMALSLLLSA